jgi:CTP:molybdopterin cytidylyltransferase MocA
MLVVAVVLAAGAGSRFLGARHKLVTEVTTELGSRPIVHHAIEHALASDVGPVVVVTGAADLGLPSEIGTRVVTVANPSWVDGQSTSIAIGIGVADAMGADQVLIGLGDQPGVSAAAWRTVAQAPAEWPIVVASYSGRRGPHPVRLHRSVWPLLPSSGDDGARTLMREHPTLVHEVPCTGTAADIDTLEDVQRWKSS